MPIIGEGRRGVQSAPPPASLHGRPWMAGRTAMPS